MFNLDKNKFLLYIRLLFMFVFIELVFYFFISPAKLMYYIEHRHHINDFYYKMQIIKDILSTLLFAFLNSIPILYYKLIIENKNVFVNNIMKSSIHNFKKFLVAKLLILITVDIIYFCGNSIIFFHRGKLWELIDTLWNCAFVSISFGIFVYLSLLNIDKRSFEFKNISAQIKYFIINLVFLKIILVSIVLISPSIIYTDYMLDFDKMLNRDNLLVNIQTMQIAIGNISIDPIYLILKIIGAALNQLYVLIKVTKLVKCMPKVIEKGKPVS
ncbi:hypothetical protein [Dethiothermospora halolimnae]|uniref:hypothetical protein n=1 Tax=Dethiothermospora halolimnae TaxID=3114390 RepID=UPI003CCC0525